MDRRLTAQECAHLKKCHRKERDKRICDRIKAVLLYDKGYSYTKVAEILLLDDETIRRHVKTYFSRNKLKPENGGSEGYLNEAETIALKAHLFEKTYLYVKDICVYVEKNFKKSYSISGMTKWLCKHNFRYKKPHGVPAKAEQAKQEAFIEHYETLKSTLKEDEVIFFLDSTHPQHQTRLTYGWIAKGTRKAEKMTACQKRINLIGAINLDNHHVEYQQVDWVNGESIKAFLNQLLEAHSEASQLHLIWDNAGYHRSKEIQSFVANTKITLHFLPPYSPNLNPIERLWKIMHEQVTYNRYYPKFSDFTEGILSFFENIEYHKTTMLSRITDNFQHLVFT